MNRFDSRAASLLVGVALMVSSPPAIAQDAAAASGAPVPAQPPAQVEKMEREMNGHFFLPLVRWLPLGVNAAYSLTSGVGGNGVATATLARVNLRYYWN